MRLSLHRLTFGLLATLIFFALFPSSKAQDEGLYAPAPPADAAFVRIFNASTGELSPTLGATTYEPLTQATVSPYRVVLQGNAALSAGSASSTLELSAGRFYTVLVTDTTTLIEDPSLSNRAKTLLLLYNLSDNPITLKTADGSTDVIPDVAPEGVGSVEVNPISVAFGAFQGDTALYTTDTVRLERGAAYSTFVLPDGTATFSQNTTD